jgi:hypothetical protein
MRIYAMEIKFVRITISIIGLLAAVLYMLHFFEILQHRYIPVAAGATVISAYLVGVYFHKKDQNKIT